MIVSIHQPNYLPWLGFFDKIKKSDVFVIFDDVQFPRGKKHFGHRNKIKTISGDKWLSVPVSNKSDLVSFNDTIINYDTKWNMEHLRLIDVFYSKSPYFNNYYKDLYEIISVEYESLTKLSVSLIKYFLKKLNINTKVKYSSKISDKNLYGADKIFDILEKIKTKEYITGSGPGSMRYIDKNGFDEREIKLNWQHYKHPTYNQLHDGFIPYLSIIDLLFNEGERSGEII
tara:strand:- start:2378 stop:3064 length:687 start_codon:yes stop_codon:yes gene_type:complete